jgi:hypothetical protein
MHVNVSEFDYTHMFILSIAHCCFSSQLNMQVMPYVFVLNDFIPLSALMPFLLLLKAYSFICMTWIVCETLVPVLHLVLKGNTVSLAFQ